MLVRSVLTIACWTTVAFSAAFAQTEPRSAFHQTLKTPSEFKSIGNQEDRSRAIFTEIGKVLTNPRCMNCHPAGDHPLQGAEHREHSPPVWRGESGAGVPGASCAMCHTESNFTLHEAATLSKHPRKSALAARAVVDELGRKNARRHLSAIERYKTAMAGAISQRCRSMLPRMTWWPGGGTPDQVANPRRAVRKRPVLWFKPGSIAERIVRNQKTRAQI